MATLLPTSQSTGVEAYEDMFKEITRKLYGEESAHGLYPHNTQVAQLAPGASPSTPGGERSFTTLVSDRSLAQLDYDNAVNDSGFKSEDHLTTAFGLAALMQNGFPPPGAILNSVNFPVAAATKGNPNIQTTSTNDDRWQQAAEEILPWNTNKLISTTVTSYTTSVPQKLFKVKTKIEPQDDMSPNSNNNNNNTSNNNINTSISIPQTPTSTITTTTDRKNNYSMVPNPGSTTKRYTCQSCPYSTDRRDLFTRHENIHKDEKPFHCYACLKQFNRADHVKKHFLRMHREMEYDISKTRRHPTASNKNYYNANNNNSTNNNSTNNNGTSNNQSQNNQPQTHTITITNTPFTTQVHNSDHGQTVNAQEMAAQINGIQNHQTQLIQHQTVTIKQEKLSVPNTSTTIVITPSIPSNNSITTLDEKPFKKKGEKRFMCCYCPWSGADNWGLKRHLNTHTKPFVCLLCDYKAARSERLATHVFKVHNKKACNKCNFFADDQQQLTSHQMEVHPHDVKSSRNNNTNNANTSNTNNVNNSHIVVTTNANNISTNVNNTIVTSTSGTNGNNSNANNGNVLRNLGNTFVPNTPLSTLHNNIQATANVFGGTSGIYHTTNTTNIIDTMNQHLTSNTNTWIPKSSSSTSTPAKKRGAELLFSYMEADGSDSEDYARLLNMQAISRNTQSVAQDFHNAGGGVIPKKSNDNDNSSNNNNNLNQQQLSLLKLLIETAVQQQRAMSTSYSPPATSTSTNSTNLPMKRRRRSLHDDKENSNESKNISKKLNGGIESSTNDNTINNNNNNDININTNNANNKNINDIFDKLYKKSYNMFLSSTFTTENSNKSSNFSMLEFLQNNKEISISSVAKTSPTKDDNQMTKHQRKQTQPRKIEKNGENRLSELLDKHMIRLVSKKKCCWLCRMNGKQENCFYHTKTSLILHKMWRHKNGQFKCNTCQMKFGKSYKLKLHNRKICGNVKC